MKYIPLLLLILMLPGLALAQTSPVCFFTPSMVEVNSLNATSFDPFVPDTQPILTQLKITNGPEAAKIDLKVQIYWNNNYLIGSVYETLVEQQPGSDIFLSNRDLITNQSSSYFVKKPGSPDISIDAAINANSVFGDAMLAGYFPDGDLQIKVKVRSYSTDTWLAESPESDAEVFTIRIRDAGFITLLSPGVPLGDTPPALNGLPLSFMWNSPETGMPGNASIITIKEFPPFNPPRRDNVETTGSLFYQTPEGTQGQTGFAEYLPFVEGNYYAWKITRLLANEYNQSLRNAPSAAVNSSLSSDWYVFKYASESEAQTTISEFQAHLNRLNDNTLLSLYSQGYTPLGVIHYEGRVISGQEALDLIDSLFGHDIDVIIKD